MARASKNPTTTRLAAGLCAAAGALTLGACGAVSTSKFSGESRNVAQTVSDFQRDASSRRQDRLCQNDLSNALIARLRSRGGCKAVLERQLLEIDVPDLKIESITVSGPTAQARVNSTWSGKTRITTLSLVKEGRRWKISGASS